MTSSNSAISVQNIIKSYGSKVILDGFSMNVERGTIYGLLGSSGCGKTTLLSCIIGRKNVDTGEIWVLGVRPGEKGSGIPGRKIGYMPQELALIDEFTIKDTMYYFGTIFKMKEKDIEQQFHYLSKLLELPDGNKLLKHCSGGQKRRVSFAAAIVHSPEILILDEPTVGVDPILREKIWAHLKSLVATKNITVIITTHYIEETREADKIGLLRKGKLLVQGSPNELLSFYNKESLEEVFLLLSQRQDESKLSSAANGISTLGSAASSTSSSMESFVAGYGSRDALTNSKDNAKSEKITYMSAMSLDKRRMKALLNKNWKQFYRNFGGIVFLLLFPIFQLWCFQNSIGKDPLELNLAIVNDESQTISCDDLNWNQTVTLGSNHECHFRNLTCRFLTYLENPMINKVLYDSFPEALESVKHGDTLGVLYMPSNFTDAYEERIHLGTDSHEWTVDFGEIKAHMDMSNRLTGGALAAKLLFLFLDFQKELFLDCNLDEKLARIPIKNNFLYVDNQKPLTIFVTPGMVIMLIYLLGTTMTCQIITRERIEGVWDRSIIAGVSALEITLSHLILQCCVMLVECLEVQVMLYFITEVEFVGNRWIIFALIYLQGVAGMAYGFLVSTVCEDSTQANLACTGGYLPLTLICGNVWPIEAIPTVLRWISMATPCTIPIISFRNIMSKGWSLWHPQVINGFGILFGWILLFGIGSVWAIKIKR
ncbi:unnamed protein product [Ceutorhynchus assimilis]|uniref:ABC transporter domain-containing protein n=1 Tax=Ceutorhynchus assimilis TaxID=467358 RepID=A0A9N9MAT0_9CUCU|nr:unnamed protein product [Ceutorhynchus assimilis]